MKTLAGANPDAKPDYRTQSLTELNKLESKVILLNEMLDNVDVQNGERFAQGDVYDVSHSIVIMDCQTNTVPRSAASRVNLEECETKNPGLDIKC